MVNGKKTFIPKDLEDQSKNLDAPPPLKTLKTARKLRKWRNQTENQAKKWKGLQNKSNI